MHAYRTHTCAQLRAEHVGQEVRISGWIHRTREHAALLVGSACAVLQLQRVGDH